VKAYNNEGKIKNLSARLSEGVTFEFYYRTKICFILNGVQSQVVGIMRHMLEIDVVERLVYM